MEDPNRKSLGIHCHDGLCHCDWRLAVHGCEETPELRNIAIICIVVTTLATIIGIPLAYYRLVIKGHKLWRPKSTGQGFLRPSPIDCLIIWFLIYSIGRLFDHAILLKDLFPDNWLGRIVSFDPAWAFALGGITLYLIGIAQTLSESHDISGWLPSPVVVDVFGSFALLLPFVICIPLGAAAGAFAEKDIYTAQLLIRVSHVFWSFGCFLTGSGVLYAATQLIRILKKRHKGSRRSPEYASIHAGITKIQIISAILVLCLGIYFIATMLYAAVRDQLMSSKAAVIVIAGPYLLLAPATNLAFEVALIYSIFKSNDKPAIKTKPTEYLSTQTASSTRPDHGFTSTVEPMTTIFFDDSRDEAISHVIEEIDPFDQQYREEQGESSRSGYHPRSNRNGKSPILAQYAFKEK
ncbi:hypothetical protein BJV82DRAFT_661670 [Fennellomyces sp. T-0311]|nr:hypothetical protein BJV82DRAFT_661670 [Fennellomyces sp. T-0311]